MDVSLWSSHEKMLTQPLKDSDAEVRWLLHRLYIGGLVGIIVGFLLLFCGAFVLFHFDFCAVRGGTQGLTPVRQVSYHALLHSWPLNCSLQS